MTLFRYLRVGDTFDWINESKPGHNSFFRRCIKTGTRTYETLPGQGEILKCRVGNLNAKVYHVLRAEASAKA